MPITNGLLMTLSHTVTTARAVLFDVGRFLALCFRSRAALAAENLFLRKQLALFEERQAHPQRATDAVRFVMFTLARSWKTTPPSVVLPDGAGCWFTTTVWSSVLPS